MARPTQAIVQWAVQDITLPGIGGANKKIPINDLQQKGYDLGQKPTADELNYLFNNWATWIAYLDEKTGGTAPEDYAVDSTPNTTAKRDSNGISCFKKIRGELADAASSIDFITTYEGKSSVTIYCGDYKVGQFVQSGLVATGDAYRGLKANTAGTHYGSVVGNVTGDLSGNAGTASSLLNKVTLKFTGDVSGSGQFYGTEGTVNITLTNTNVNPPQSIVLASASTTATDRTVTITKNQLIRNIKVYLRSGDVVVQADLSIPLLQAMNTGVIWPSYQGDDYAWGVSFVYSQINSTTATLRIHTPSRGSVYMIIGDQ